METVIRETPRSPEAAGGIVHRFKIARAANELGWQMAVHVTGGGSLDVLLDAYEAADRESSTRDRRFTVTHGNFPGDRAIARAKKLEIVFDCQPRLASSGRAGTQRSSRAGADGELPALARIV